MAASCTRCRSGEPSREENRLRPTRIIFALCAAALLLAAAPAGAAEPTLAAVKKRGELVCGSNGHLPGLSEVDSQQKWTGFEVDFCHAVAAAVLGDAMKVRFVPLTTIDRFDALRSGKVDLVVRNSAATLTRTVGTGVRDAVIVYVDGQAVAVPKKLNVTTLKELDGARICLLKGSIYGAAIEDWFQSRKMTVTLLTFDTQAAVYDAFFEGKCSAVTQDITAMVGTLLASGKAADYMMLPDIVSRNPLAAYVRAGDDEWYDVVRWTLVTMIDAEERGIDQLNVDQLRVKGTPSVRKLLGGEDGNGKLLGLNPLWAYNIVKQVGNYNDVYERNVGVKSALKFPRGVNGLWNNGGVQYGLPYR
jgi:general L-amino acid transport system substrate-binding protein